MRSTTRSRPTRRWRSSGCCASPAPADANPGGEIDVALRAGFIPPEIVFTGVAKTDAELAQAIDLGVKTINAESEGELERIDAIARERQTRASVAIRVNPDIDARSHRRSRRAQDQQVRRLDRRRATSAIGCAIAPGSRSSRSTPTSARRSWTSSRCGARRGRRRARHRAERQRIAIEHLDLGGGLGISYDGTPAPTAEAARLRCRSPRHGASIVLEPGRYIVGPAGALLTRVVDVKPQPGGKLFVILDAGMTELIRPMLYKAYHRIEPVEPRDDPEVLRHRRSAVREQRYAGQDRPVPQPGWGICSRCSTPARMVR